MWALFQVSELYIYLPLDISTWGVFRHLQLSMSSWNGPLSKPSQTLILTCAPILPAVHTAPLALLGTWPTTLSLCCTAPIYALSINPFFSIHPVTLLVAVASESAFPPPIAPLPQPQFILYTRRNFNKWISDHILLWVELCNDFSLPLWWSSNTLTWPTSGSWIHPSGISSLISPHPHPLL